MFCQPGRAKIHLQKLLLTTRKKLDVNYKQIDQNHPVCITTIYHGNLVYQFILQQPFWSKRRHYIFTICASCILQAYPHQIFRMHA